MSLSQINTGPLQVDGSGNLKVNVAVGGGTGGTASTIGATYPGSATAAGAKDSGGNLAALNLDASGFLKVNVAAGSGSGFSASDGTAFTAGTTAAVPASAVFNDSATALTTGTEGTLRCTTNRGLHSNLRNASGTEIGTLSNAVRTDPIGTTAQPVTGTFWQATQPVSAASLPLPTGAATSAKQPALGTAGTASSDVITVQGIASMTALKVDASATTQPVSGTFWQATQPVSGTVSANATQTGTWTVQPGNTANSTPWLVSSVPATSGGLSSTKLISAASTNATSVKASAGQLYNVQAFNTNASARYLKMYNKASAPTVGTDTPVATWLIPASSSGFIIEVSNGLAFATGIAFALTTGMADSDTGAVGATEVALNIQYK